MSVNLSVNLSFSNKFKKADPTEEEAQKKKNGAKQNPLLNAKTDPYVDDNEAFQPRISRADKYEYWRALLPNKGARRPLPKAFISWKSKEIADVNEEANYSRVYLYSFNFIRNGMWDQRFLNLFIVFLVLVVFFVDKWADSLAPSVAHMNAGNQIIVIPPILMFLTQLIPCLGMMYFVSNGNDLVHFRAVKEMGSWVSVTLYACMVLICRIVYATNLSTNYLRTTFVFVFQLLMMMTPFPKKCTVYPVCLTTCHRRWWPYSPHSTWSSSTIAAKATPSAPVTVKSDTIPTPAPC